MDPSPAPSPGGRPPLAVPSARARVQRFGAPRDAARLLARLVASVGVVAGAVTAAALISTGLAAAVGLMGFFCVAMAALVALPLGAAMVWTWLFALFARDRPGGVYVGRSLCVEHGRSLDTFAPVDVLSVGADALGAPGSMTIWMADGDRIHADLASAADVEQVARAVADAGARGPWLAPLYELAPASPRRRWTAVLLTLLVALAAAVLPSDSFITGGGLFGCAGLLLWLTVLRPAPPRRRLAIGTNGVDLRGDAEGRFLPFTRIERVEPTPWGAEVVLVDGARVPLAVVPPALLAARDAPAAELRLGSLRRAALLERLQAGIAAGDVLAGEERLACQGRSVTAWREAVRELVHASAPGYRVALLPVEQAARIVEKGRAAPDARIGAALALAGAADEALRGRLRIAIEDCADEATQAALALALEDRLDPGTLARVQRAGERR